MYGIIVIIENMYSDSFTLKINASIGFVASINNKRELDTIVNDVLNAIRDYVDIIDIHETAGHNITSNIKLTGALNNINIASVKLFDVNNEKLVLKQVKIRTSIVQWGKVLDIINNYMPSNMMAGRRNVHYS